MTMLGRLISLGRPAAEAAAMCRVAVAAGMDHCATAFSTLDVPTLSRDGGRDASTSYGSDTQACWWSPSPPASAPCALPSSPLQQLRLLSTQSRPPQQRTPQGKRTPAPATRPASQPSAVPTHPPSGSPAAGPQKQRTGSPAPKSPASTTNTTSAAKPSSRNPRGTQRGSSPAGPSGAAPSPTPTARQKPSSTPGTLKDAAAAPTPAPAVPSASEGASEDAIQGLDMESLMRVILHPLPLGRVRNPALFSGSGAPVVQLGNDLLFFDPAHTLSSTMRALHIIRQVLRTDGNVLVINPNPTMRPLLREAAYLSLNSNVWFWFDDWQPGLLADPDRSLGAIMSHRRQPNRVLLKERGLTLRNPLCPPGSPEAVRRAAPAAAPPALPAEDVRRLLSGAKRSNTRWEKDEYRAAIDALAAAQAAEARLLPNGSPPTRNALSSLPQLALVVCLDLSYGGDVLREAHSRNIPTVSLLNGHSDASCVTFPVYASEAHAGFQHWFLEWLLRVVNLPPPNALRGYEAEAAGRARAG